MKLRTSAFGAMVVIAGSAQAQTETIACIPLNSGGTVVAGSGGNVVTSGPNSGIVIVSGSANAGGFVVIQGSGNDTVVAGTGYNTVTAGLGNNVINIGSAANTVSSGTGNTVINTGTLITPTTIGSATPFCASGGSGNSTLLSGLGSDTIPAGGYSSQGGQFSTPDADGSSAVPEPGEWAMMTGGLALVGAALRRRRRDPGVRIL